MRTRRICKINALEQMKTTTISTPQFLVFDPNSTGLLRLALSLWTWLQYAWLIFFSLVTACYLQPSHFVGWATGPGEGPPGSTRWVWCLDMYEYKLQQPNVECVTVWDRNGDNSMDCAGNRNGGIKLVGRKYIILMWFPLVGK